MVHALSTCDNYILFGVKSVGKSTIGRSIAEHLGYDFLDTDEAITALYQQKYSIRELFEMLGEVRFRQLEHDFLRLLKPPKRSVIACGGGTLMLRENIDIIKAWGKLFHLYCDPEVLRTRLEKDPPYFMNEFEFVFKQRVAYYQSIADKTIDVTTWDQIALDAFFE